MERKSLRVAVMLLAFGVGVTFAGVFYFKSKTVVDVPPVMELSKQREVYVSAERRKSGKQNGFDAAVISALAEQLAAKGID